MNIIIYSMFAFFIILYIGGNKSESSIAPQIEIEEEIVYNIKRNLEIYDTKESINTDIEHRFGLPNGILHQVHMKETSGRCHVESKVGAQGCFQFMPITIKHIEQKFNVKIEPFDYKSSAQGSALYLVYLKEKLYKAYPNLNNEVLWGLTLAAYNAGPSNGLRWAKEAHGIKTVSELSEIISFHESRNYTLDIGEKVFGKKHVVKSGESLYSISKKYNININKLIAHYNVNIKPGDIINL